MKKNIFKISGIRPPPYNICAITVDYYMVATLDTIRAKIYGSSNFLSPINDRVDNLVTC